MSPVHLIGRIRFAAVLGGLVACTNPIPVGQVDQMEDPQPKLAIDQCPHTWEVRWLDPALPPQPIEISITGRQGESTTNVPEYHDCQRLINTDSTYGPLVAAFARNEHDGLLGERLRSLESATDGKTALAAIELWNVDSTTYTPLGILPGFSCLYVARRGDGWRGKLVRYGWPQPKCEDAVNLDALAGIDLTVNRRITTSTDFTEDDFPPVVRWEWDETHQHQYLGFKCDRTSWCEAGLPGFSSVASLATPNTQREVRRVFEIRGWLDEQHLANPATPTTPATPGTVRGTVIPNPDLKRTTLGAVAGRWVLASFVLLSGPSDTYAQKFNFVPTTAASLALAPANTSTTSLCWAGQRPCAGVPADATCAVSGSATVGTGQWWARFDAPGRPPIYKCVRYRPHPAAAIGNLGTHTLGTARWRWIKDDESTWVGCPDGCCETSGGIS